MKDMNWIAVYPELLLLVMALIVAMVDLWVTDPKRTPTYLLAQVSLLAVALMHLHFYDQGDTLYGMQGMVVTDPMGHLLSFFATVSTMIALAYSRPYAASRDML